MRLLSLPLSTLLPLLALLTPISASSCSLVRVEKESYDFSALDGEHSVSTITDSPAGTVNTTYTLNPCQALRPSKDTPKSLQCPKGTWVCGIEYMGDTEEPVLIPIAGSDVLNGHKAIDLKWSLLSSSPSNKDSEREGVRLEMHGGLFPQKGSKGIKQEAVIEFICDLERTGLEDSARRFTVRAADDREDEGEEEEEKPFDDEDPDEGDDEGTDDPVDNEPEVGSDKDRSLRFISYGNRKGGKVLRLEWRTKHACRGHRDEQKEANKKGHWGGFTWFIIILFLATAAYLIFGSWLNYNRYGARGWDLLPHGDTIRDVPYLMKDWTRRVVSTVQGGGSRGGYSAV